MALRRRSDDLGSARMLAPSYIPSVPEQSDLERGESDSLINGSVDGDAAGRKALLSNHDGQHSAGRGAGEEAAAAVENRQRTVTTVLINLSAIMERTDEQLLPAVYRFVGESFQVCLACTVPVSKTQQSPMHGPGSCMAAHIMRGCQPTHMGRARLDTMAAVRHAGDPEPAGLLDTVAGHRAGPGIPHWRLPGCADPATTIQACR